MYMDKIVQNLTYNLPLVIHKHMELFIFLKMIKESGNSLPNNKLVMGVFLHIMKKKKPHTYKVSCPRETCCARNTWV